MAHTVTLVCLANSYRKGGHCIAGKPLLPGRFGEWVRPVSLRATAELSNAECHYADRSTPHLLDLIHIPLLEPVPSAHQAENFTLDHSRRFVKIGALDWSALPALCDQPPTLWNLSEHTANGKFNCISPQEAEAQTYSLTLIHVRDLRILIGADRRDANRPYSAAFTWNHIAYILRVTDPLVLAAFMAHPPGEQAIGEAFLCVSLSHPFHGHCHKLVAAVITNPRLT